jgi:hypothetical protein
MNIVPRDRLGEIPGPSTAGNDRPDFDLVGIGEHFIFRNQVITPNHQMRLDHEIQFAQHFFGALGAFDFHLALGMTQLDDHGAMIRLTRAGLQTPRKTARLSQRGTHFNVKRKIRKDSSGCRICGARHIQADNERLLSDSLDDLENQEPGHAEKQESRYQRKALELSVLEIQLTKD